MMTLYYAPLACSLSSRIAFYEAGADVQYSYANTRTKRLADGSDYFKINPMGQVPALRTEEGEVLTENTAVLQYVADHLPQAKLAPASGPERSKLQQWLGFIGTELHKTVFVPLLDSKASAEVKAYARDKAALRLDVLQNYLKGREFLLDSFTVADAYLVTVLNWAAVSGVKLAQWPAVSDYYQRLLKRPSIARAVGEEYAMYQEEQTRQAKA